MGISDSCALQLDGGRARLDLAARQLSVGGHIGKLGSRAYDLLVALIERRDRMVPKQELLDVVWPGLVVEENNLQVQVATLRRLLGPQAITTVSGRGYRFTLPVAAEAGPPAGGFWPGSAGADGGNDLLGRDALLQQVAGLLAQPQTRLVTLTGPGGSGKTRLALRITADHARQLRDGACTVMLAAVHDVAGALSALATALGLQESGAAPAAELVRHHLKGRQLLLTLDNLEHLPDLNPLLPGLLAQAPGIQMLLTSRTVTRLPGEVPVQVPPLALPASDTAADLRASAAVQLLAQRAQALGRTVADNADDLRAAAAICRRLDGLPLAIELAAARLRLLTPQTLAERLSSSLPLLTQGAAGVPAHHQTLRSAIAWSHDLLDAPTQRLLRALGCFSGGWTLEAAEALDDDPDTVIDRLSQLLDHHLVQRVDDVEGQARYAMLETLREFAIEQAAAAGEMAALRERHARHHARLAQLAATHLTSAARRPWLARLRAELNNLRAALAWLVRERHDAATAVPMAAALSWLWYFEGLYQEGRSWIAEVQALPGPPAAPADRAALLSGAARLAAYSGDLAAARDSAARSVALWRESGDARGLAYARFHEGIAGIVSARLEPAREALTETLQLFQSLDDAWGIALAVSYLGTAYAVEPGQEDRARPLLLEGRARFHALRDDWGLTVSSHYLGSIELRVGAYPAARELTQEMLGNARELGDRYRIARNLHQLAEIAMAQGVPNEALTPLAESLELNAAQLRLGDAALQLRLLARLLVEVGRPEAAVCCAALAARHQDASPTMPGDDIGAHESRLEQLRSRIPTRRFQQLWAEGGLWRFEDAAAAARAPA